MASPHGLRTRRPEMSNTLVKSPIYNKLVTMVYMSK